MIGWLNFPESVTISKLPCRQRCKKQPTTALAKTATALVILLFLFDFSWFIVGNVFVFGGRSAGCSLGLVAFIYGILVGQWIVLTLVIVVFLAILPFLCCACCTTACACCIKACCCEEEDESSGQAKA